MLKYILHIVCAFLLAGSYPALSQQVTVRASLDSTVMLIGSQTGLMLEVTKPEGIGVQFPLIVDTLSRMVEVVEQSGTDSSATGDGAVRLVRNLIVTSFDSGYHVIPPLPFLIGRKDGGTDTLYSQSLGLEILLVPVDTSQAIKPIKGPEDIPYTLRDAMPWILGGLLIALLIVALYFYFKKRKKPAEPADLKPIPKEPPHVIALRSLDQLKSEQLWQSGKQKVYYSRLTEIVREYIEHRYRIRALEQTSDEILRTFKNAGLSESIPFEPLRQLLYLADQVKFAKGTPQPDENHRSLEQAYEFVKKTRDNENKN